MHYYQFNIGDYQSHTSHLTEMEDLAYRRMIEWCYLHERALPVEIAEIGRLIRMRSHSDSIATVLREFFESTADGWSNARVVKEIVKFGEKSEKARRSAKSRWDANALPTQSEGNAKQEPRTTNQEPIDIEPKGSLSGSAFPPCPQREILWLWKEKLPHLAQPRIWEGSRAAALRQRWVQASKPSAFNKDGYTTQDAGLEWWGSFFNYIAKDTKLSNGFESQGRVWKPDLEWVVNATNFQKIIDGKYDQ
jgi:uncharacterized protein YdaU (DUF1376 family)